MKALLFACLLLLGISQFPVTTSAADSIAPIIAPGKGNIDDGSYLTAPITVKCQSSVGNCHAEKSIIEPLFLKIGGLLTLLAGILAVFSIVINGIRYVTSAGDPAKAKTARSGILAALIGVILAMLAYTFIHFAQVAGGFAAAL